MFHTIERVVPRPDHEVLLYYSDRVQIVVDFDPVISRGGVFASLAARDIFAQVTVGEGGRYIEWPGGIDFCADALRKQGRLAPTPKPRKNFASSRSGSAAKESDDKSSHAKVSQTRRRTRCPPRR